MTKFFGVLTLMLQFVALGVFAQGPNNSGTYYKSADGLKGKALKTAMFKIVSSHTQLSYKNIWTAFKTTDKRDDGKVWDCILAPPIIASEQTKQGTLAKKATNITVSILSQRVGLMMPFPCTRI